MRHALEIRLDNRLPEIPRLADLVESFGVEHGVPDRAIFNLNLALDEILTNVIEHAFADDDGHEILVRLAVDERSIRAEVIDDGLPYDPTARPDPDITLALEDRPIGGLGVYFAKRMMDRIEYRRDAGTNRLSLVRLIDQDRDSGPDPGPDHH
ncbi:MAG: ATP-binding protein [Rhodospirillaceae bacterium]